MKVGMYYNNSDVRIEELPIPVPGSKDVLIKVKVCGICGSDLLQWYRQKSAPRVLGHELSGEVVETGTEVDRYKKGDRVFAIHHVPCDNCPQCKAGHLTACRSFQEINNFAPGGFSQYLKISGKSVATGIFKLPVEVSFEEGTFIEPLGTVIRGQRACVIQPGDSVLIFGAGLAGLLHIKTAYVSGAGNIIAVDIHKNRLDRAVNFGASFTTRPLENLPELIKEVNKGRLVDKVLICTGALAAANLALQCVARGGTVLFFAVPRPDESIKVDFNRFWKDDITIKTSYGSAPLDHSRALELIKSGKVVVKDLISHRFSLDKIQQGFSLASQAGKCLKVLITMDD